MRIFLADRIISRLISTYSIGSGQKTDLCLSSYLVVNKNETISENQARISLGLYITHKSCNVLIWAVDSIYCPRLKIKDRLQGHDTCLKNKKDVIPVSSMFLFDQMH